MSRKTATIVIAIAVLVAAFLRLWQLDMMPPGFYHDEAYNALDALSLLEERTFPQFYEGWELYRFEAHGERGAFETKTPIFFEGNYGREPLHVYLMALSVTLFGAEVWAVRLVPALAGVLGVVTTAWVAWLLAPVERRWEVAAFAAWAVAILFPAVHFSRFGLRGMLFLPVQTLCVGLFWKGLTFIHSEERGEARARQTRWFVSAGILLGFGLYVYAAARMLPLVFVIFCAWYLWRATLTPSPSPSGRGEYAWTVSLRDFMVMAGVAFVVALPMLLYFWAYPYFLFFRSQYVATHGLGVVEGRPILTAVLNFGRIARGFVWQGETHLRHNLPGRPFLDAIQLFFAGIGLLIALRWRSDKWVFVLIWFFVMWLPSVLSGDAPHFGRLVGVIPAVAILIGNGATFLYHSLRHARALIFIAFIVSTVWTYYDYFIVYGNHPDIATDFYLSDRELGEWAATLPAGTDIYLTPTQEELATILFGMGNAREQFRNYGGEVVLFGRPETPTVHLVRTTDSATQSRLEPFTIRREQIQADWVAIWVDHHIFAPIGTLDETIAVAASVNQLASGQVEVVLDWQLLDTVSADLTAFVHLIAEDGTIIAQQDRPPRGYPTSDWKVDEIVQDRFVLDTTECPDCQLITGFYDPASSTRLGEPIPLLRSENN